jgi:hypothetical protein
VSPDLVQLATVGGPVAVILAFFVIGLVRGWIVPGYIYERERQARQDMQDAVLRSTEAARLALETGRRRAQDAEADRR